jgi:hypothetical protein
MPANNSYVMTPESLRQTISEFLADSRSAIVIEDGAVLFDLAQSKYSISGEYNKCLIHFWSTERNVVRRVLEAEVKSGAMRLQVQRMGQNHPTKLEICRERDRRAPSAQRVARQAYGHRLRRALEHHFPEWSIARPTTSMDLEHSFGPAFARGLMWRGQSALAVVGVNEGETQASIDAALTSGILWLDSCRHRQTGRALVEGLALVLPQKTSALTRERIAHLNSHAAKWQLYEFSERDGLLEPVDCADRGNLHTRLVHATDEETVRARFVGSMTRIRGILGSCEVAVLSPAEISFRLRGLEFARARIAHDPRSFQSGQEIVFGIGGEERVLDDSNEADFTNLVHLAAAIREKDGPHSHPLWRMHPERWLESLALRDLQALDRRLTTECVYSQVPAFSASDRAMLDVLTLTQEARLAILELKADEDIHLPLQGLDYWARVTWHQSRSEFTKFGYFAGRALSQEKPLLFLVAPALHVHPATDTILRYLSPEIEWELLGIDEHWRDQIRVVFRKRPSDSNHQNAQRRSA